MQRSQNQSNSHGGYENAGAAWKWLAQHNVQPKVLELNASGGDCLLFFDFPGSEPMLADSPGVLESIASSSVDIVVIPDFDALATEMACRSPDKVLAEAARILSDSGALFCKSGNRYGAGNLRSALSKARVTSSRRAICSSLRRAGFRSIEEFALDDAGRFFDNVRHLSGGSHPLASKNCSTLGQWIKGQLLPDHLLYVASKQPESAPSPLQAAIDALGCYFSNHRGAGKLEVLEHQLTRKGKLILSVRWNDMTFVAKFPCTTAAENFETNNYSLLEVIASGQGPSVKAPDPIYTGTSNNLKFFCEEFLQGVPLSQHLRQHGRLCQLEQVFDLLCSINPALRSKSLQTRNLTGSCYDILITDRIERIRTATQDDVLASYLSSYFDKHLQGVTLNFGVLHGDFSASNILVQENGGAGLIDWETADLSAPAALDVINYLESVERLFNKGAMVNVTYPSLAAKRWSQPEEIDLLERVYAYYDVDTSLHSAMVYLRWLRHVSYLLNFWLAEDQSAQKTYIYDVVDAMRADS